MSIYKKIFNHKKLFVATIIVVIIGLVLFLVLADQPDKQIVDSDSAPKYQPTTIEGSGQFVVGRDIAAGRYVVTANEGQSGYFSVDSDYRFRWRDRLNNNINSDQDDGVGRITVDLKQSDIIEITDIKKTHFNPVATGSKPKYQPTTIEGSGQFVVGRDIAAGRYVVTANEGQSGYFSIDIDGLGFQDKLNNNINSDQDDGVGRITVDLKQSDIIEITDIKKTHFNPVATGSKPKYQPTTIEGSGQFVVGRDIAAGRYVVTANEGQSGYFSVDSDYRFRWRDKLNNNINSDQDDGVGRITVDLKQSDIIEITDIKKTHFNPVATGSKPKYQPTTIEGSGQFVVGRDIAAGRYVVTANEGQSGYFSVDGLGFQGKLNSNINSDQDDGVGRITVDLKQSDIIEITDIKKTHFNPVATGSKPKYQPTTIEGSGQFVIGRDIAAGRYVVTAGSIHSGSFEVSDVSGRTFSDLLSGDSEFDHVAKISITLHLGDRLQIQGIGKTNFTPLANPSTPQYQNTTIEGSGRFVVGRDIAAGRYRVFGRLGTHGKFEVLNNEHQQPRKIFIDGSLGSERPIVVNLKRADIVQITGVGKTDLISVPATEYKEMTIDKDSQLVVGWDIAPGRYGVTVTDGIYASLTVRNSIEEDLLFGWLNNNADFDQYVDEFTQYYLTNFDEQDIGVTVMHVNLEPEQIVIVNIVNEKTGKVYFTPAQNRQEPTYQKTTIIGGGQFIVGQDLSSGSWTVTTDNQQSGFFAVSRDGYSLFSEALVGRNHRRGGFLSFFWTLFSKNRHQDEYAKTKINIDLKLNDVVEISDIRRTHFSPIDR